MARRRKDGPPPRVSGLHLDKGAERLPRSYFQKYPVRVLQQLSYSVGKAHGLAQMLRPIRWVRRFGGCDPRPAHIRDEWNGRGTKIHCSYKLGEIRQYLFNHLRMACGVNM